jgi:hypothetical protein
MKNRFIVAATLALAGCAPIQHTETLATGPSSGYAGPGDLVARVEKQRDLENIAGRADIWGRKTNEGFTELRFGGTDGQGQAILFRTDTNIVTNETTMSRSPFSTTVAHVDANRSQANVVATSINPTTDYHALAPAGAMQIVVPKGTGEIPFEGHIVHILAVSSTSLSYKID